MSANDNVKWVRLGDLIEPLERRNTNKEFDISSVRGISNTKEIMATKAGVDEQVIHKFYVIKYGEFIYNPRTTRMGEKVGLGYNNTDSTFLFSFNNLAFKIKDSARKLIIPDYLFLNFKREHFDRFARINSWGSATELFLFSDLCTFQIPLPSIEVQQKLVDIYNGLKSLAEQNEALIEPLNKTCEAFIIDCKSRCSQGNIGKYIEEYDERNSDCKKYPFYGINKDKAFMHTVADTNNLDNSKYKIVNKGNFVFSGMQTGRDVCIRIALYSGNEPIIISPAYTTFKIKDCKRILPQYLFIQFKRYEMDRYGWFLSDGSIRSNLDWDRFCDIKIPLPPLEVQQSIVDLYKCLEEAKKIASEAREKLKTLCPALVQKAANS